MQAGGRSGWRTAGALAVLAIVSVAGALAPVGASAVDSDLKHAFALRLEASNGYSIIALAANERADGRGEVVLFVSRGNEGAIYGAPAMLTATSVEADLGPLGEVSLDVIPSGREKRIRSGCRGEPETTRIEPQRFRGNFEFHGEEGYTDAVTDAPREYTQFFLGFVCAGAGGGEMTEGSLPGARLKLHSRSGPDRLELQANKNRPRARSRFEVEVREERGKMQIFRSTSLWAGAEAFQYDPLLKTATLDPPAPFSGEAQFGRGAAPANRWTGNLAVDLPGRSNVRLSSAGTRATLIPACWQGAGARGPAACGFR
jgi:hypothetical protein